MHPGASEVVRTRLDYSPVDIHKYSFWLATTSGVLDLIAYSEDSYVTWLTQINKIAYDMCEDPLSLLSSPQTSGVRQAWSDHPFIGITSNGTVLQNTVYGPVYGPVYDGYISHDVI